MHMSMYNFVYACSYSHTHSLLIQYHSFSHSFHLSFIRTFTRLSKTSGGELRAHIHNISACAYVLKLHQTIKTFQTKKKRNKKQGENENEQTKFSL